MATMAPMKPEDKPKVIALGAATLVMFGYVGVSFARSKSAASAPAPAASATPLAPAPLAAAPAATLPGSATAQEAAPLNGKAPAPPVEALAGAARQRIVLPNLNTDPFHPAISHKTVLNAPPKGARMTELPKPFGAGTSVAPRGGYNLPTLTVSEAPGASGVVPPSGGASTIVLPPPGTIARPTAAMTAPMNTAGLTVVPIELTLTLNGVITGGAGNVALVQVGEGEQFVSVGDVISRWRVLRIGIDTLTLRRGNQVRVLRIGAGNGAGDAVPIAPLVKAKPAVSLPKSAALPTPAPVSLPTVPLPVEAPPAPPSAPVPQAPSAQVTPAMPPVQAPPAPQTTPTPAPTGPPVPVVG